jgi:hypothetical protein
MEIMEPDVIFQLAKESSMVHARALRSVSLSFLPLALFLLAVLGTIGCSIQNSAPITPSATSAARTLQGRVYGGQQPVVGATIQLYAAGTSGNGLGATPLIGTLTKTDSNGDFNFTYTLPSTPSHFYIVATGGSPGKSNPANPKSVLMAALGGCTASTTIPSSFININEVTTIASVSALQTFMALPAAGNVGAPVIGAQDAASNDLRNAFETVSNLVNISTGVIVTPTNSNGQLINTLADILAHCVNSDPNTENYCSTLFSDATPSGGTLAADTTQAALYIAQNPSHNVSALFGLIPPSPPFVALHTVPADFNVSLPPTSLVACFAVLGGSTVTNTGSTIVSGGDLGLSPGTSVTGFPPGIVTSPAEIYAADATAANAQKDLTTAYNYAAGLTAATVLPADMSGLTLTPGVYSISSTAQLSSNMTLDAQGDSNAVFIFQIGSTLTTASGTQVVLANSAQAKNIFWLVGTSATRLWRRCPLLWVPAPPLKAGHWRARPQFH